MKKNKYDLIIVGGGAAGLMAAITAAKKSKKVLILEHQSCLGRKILSTGNGRCNFTNHKQGIRYYLCDDPAFVISIIRQFSAEDTVSFFRELGIRERKRDGYYYPRTNQAATVLNGLLYALKLYGVEVALECELSEIEKGPEGFLCKTNQRLYRGTACLIATGGCAAPKLGSDGSGYALATQFGHHIKQPLPSLTALETTAVWKKETSGVRCEACLSLWKNGQFISKDTGELQMTEYGLSGIPIFQISHHAIHALEEGSRAEILINFLPEFSESEIITMISPILCGYTELLKKSDHHRKPQAILALALVKTLGHFVHHKLASMLVRQIKFSKSDPERVMRGEVSECVTSLLPYLTEFKVEISGYKGFDFAQVTSGGVDISELYPKTMESKLVSGLYFAGEIVDVDGLCGGYNLQWAWSSGYVVGKHI